MADSTHPEWLAAGEKVAVRSRGGFTATTVMAACVGCGTIHGICDTRAQNRFSPTGATGYRADLPGAPLRPTRAEAVQDVCDARRNREA